MLDTYELGSLTLPNRIVMAPMTRARATEDGLPVASMATYYAQRATAGLIVSEGMYPSAASQSNPNAPGIHSDAQVAAWRPVTAAVHANGGRIFAQIMHGGRVVHPETAGHHPVGPSAIALDAEVFTPQGLKPAVVPRALTTEEVRGEVAVFADAARRAVDAGFDGVELHGANGYLIQQFLSSTANQRTDAYGGSIAGRIRFAVEVAEACAAAIGADLVGIRLSPGGPTWGMAEDDVPDLYGALIAALAPLGLGYVHVMETAEEDVLLAMRKMWPGAFMVNPGGQMLAAKQAEQTGREAGDYWLWQGADLISYGRAYLANPDLVERFRLGLPLRPAPDRETWYAGGDADFVTYPTHQH
ncbi:alkene reductase [Nocardioides immobilis]|uniref:Alkene reductase n=1 Tax=Nocardioides immobilis TaxID=2049295 RepID=A0A417Y765_9ACTN|nr:alkene reductase [Nocardioides immobilis]RHW28326.1 alkene reductase [Nocardioides immobilis]